MRRFAALADETKGVVLHNGGAANAAQEALLHATVEAEDCYFGGGLNAVVSFLSSK
jgi:hypothetical protein